MTGSTAHEVRIERAIEGSWYAACPCGWERFTKNRRAVLAQAAAQHRAAQSDRVAK